MARRKRGAFGSDHHDRYVAQEVTRFTSEADLSWKAARAETRAGRCGHALHAMIHASAAEGQLVQLQGRPEIYTGKSRGLAQHDAIQHFEKKCVIKRGR